MSPRKPMDELTMLDRTMTLSQIKARDKILEKPFLTLKDQNEGRKEKV